MQQGRALSPVTHVQEGTLHQTRPKIDTGGASLLMGIATVID
jgi:hypothetical protein